MVKKFFWLSVIMLIFSVNIHAADGVGIDNAGIFDNVLNRYSSAASAWATVITAAASRLFWSLVTISMVWTFGMMALRKADIGEFFAEFTRFIITTGFFWWLLINGPSFASSIYASMRQLGGEASGLGHALSPSSIVDVGFAVFEKVMDQSSAWQPVDSMTGILLALAILVILALVAVNMLLLLASGWILAYGGVFFLGFGGSRWTSDMAINYYKTVLGVAVQLMAMVLLVGIGKTFLDDYYMHLSEGVKLKEMAVMLIVVIILLALTNKIPALLAGIITGASVGGMGIGQFGAGAALGAAGMAAAAAATGGAAIAAGVTSAAGGGSAVMAAFSKARENISGGMDIASALGGLGGGGDKGGGTAAAGGGSSSNGSGGVSGGSTPFAQAAGFSGKSSSASSGLSKSQGSEGKESSSSGASVTQGSENKGSASKSGGFMASAAKAGRITAEASKILANSAADMAKTKAAGITSSVRDRIAATTGGKIAAAIRGQGKSGEDNGIAAGPTFSGNSLSPELQSEVLAFAHRGQQTDCSQEEAQQAGAFAEDALSEKDVVK